MEILTYLSLIILIIVTTRLTIHIARLQKRSDILFDTVVNNHQRIKKIEEKSNGTEL